MKRISSKVVFCDGIGVFILPQEYEMHKDKADYIPTQFGHISRAAIENLNTLCTKTGCKLVITSDLRFSERVKEAMIESGFTGSFHQDWRTPSITDLACHKRGREINQWLAAHPATSYAIIDDNDTFLPRQKKRLILTHAETCMTALNRDAVMRALKPTKQFKKRPGVEPKHRS